MGVFGSPWKAVTMDDKRVYYYNEATKQTTWEKPDELKDDVEVSTDRDAMKALLTCCSAQSLAQDGKSIWPMARDTLRIPKPSRRRGPSRKLSRKSSIATRRTNHHSARLLLRHLPLGLRALLCTQPRMTTGAPNATNTAQIDMIETVTVTAIARQALVEKDRTSVSPSAPSSSSPVHKKLRLPS